MQSKLEKSLYEVFSDPTDNALSNLLRKVQQLNQLNQLLQYILEPAFTAYCRVANFQNKVLIIETDSSAWAMRLHFLIPDLLKKLRKTEELRNLEKIEYYVKLATESKIKSRQFSPLSSENATLLIETANHTNNTALKRALRHLANHTVNKS